MKGFTLIETVIAIVVIGIAFLGLLAALTGVFTNAARDEVMTIAVMLAKGEMEKVTGEGFSVTADSGTYGDDFSNYSWEVIVSAVPVDIASDPGMAQYKQVEAAVTNTMIGTISLKTILTNN